MKKTLISLILLLTAAALLLCACGSAKPQSKAVPDMQKVYDTIAAKGVLPEMAIVDGDRRFDLLGIDPADCRQAVTAICGDSVRADEIWLVEAVDADAAARVYEMAEVRVDQKKRQLENYLPDQFAVVEKAVLLREDNAVILFISPEAETMLSLYRAGN